MGRVTRVGAVQWLMETLDSSQAFLERVDYHIDVLADYGCQCIVFPEFFGIPLLAGHDQSDPPAALRALAHSTPALVGHIANRARARGVYVVAGSFPALENGGLENHAYLCTPAGEVHVQPKLHPTPNERARWGMRGGQGLQVWDTPIGRLAILICYDVEFPELGRRLAALGVDILCVPSWTDIRHGYHRVRWCAQARAVENECYVVLAGSTGQLQGVVNADIQYSRAAILTPADQGFPHDGCLAEADINVPGVIMADLDLDRLTWLRTSGAVRNGQDRRHDLYALDWKPQAEASS